MHALLQLLVLIGAFGLYEGVARKDDRRMRMIGVVALSSSLFTHLLSVPLIAVILVGLVGSTVLVTEAKRTGGLNLQRVLWSEIVIVTAAGTLRWSLVYSLVPWGAGEGGLSLIPKLCWTSATFSPMYSAGPISSSSGRICCYRL